MASRMLYHGAILLLVSSPFIYIYVCKMTFEQVLVSVWMSVVYGVMLAISESIKA